MVLRWDKNIHQRGRYLVVYCQGVVNEQVYRIGKDFNMANFQSCFLTCERCVILQIHIYLESNEHVTLVFRYTQNPCCCTNVKKMSLRWTKGLLGDTNWTWWTSFKQVVWSSGMLESAQIYRVIAEITTGVWGHTHFHHQTLQYN